MITSTWDTSTACATATDHWQADANDDTHSDIDTNSLNTTTCKLRTATSAVKMKDVNGNEETISQRDEVDENDSNNDGLIDN